MDPTYAQWLNIEVESSDRHTYCLRHSIITPIALAAGSVSCVFTPISVNPSLLTIRWGASTLLPPLGKPRARIIWRGHGRELLLWVHTNTWSCMSLVLARHVCTLIHLGRVSEWTHYTTVFPRVTRLQGLLPPQLSPHIQLQKLYSYNESLLVLTPGVSLGVFSLWERHNATYNEHMSRITGFFRISSVFTQ